MAIKFHRAQRKKAKLRLAIAGPAGSGKTYSALLTAFGLGGPVALIDTERGSGELYAHLGEYDVCTLTAPFTPEKYVEAIRAAESTGYNVIIIDSLSHAWAGPGGVLDIHGYAADKGGNSWSAWRQVTPRHNELVDTMLQSRCHIIATLRSKMEHVQTIENGKTVIKKVGMNPSKGMGWSTNSRFSWTWTTTTSPAPARTAPACSTGRCSSPHRKRAVSCWNGWRPVSKYSHPSNGSQTWWWWAADRLKRAALQAAPENIPDLLRIITAAALPNADRARRAIRRPRSGTPLGTSGSTQVAGKVITTTGKPARKAPP
jgi:hypothetical protein